MDMSMSMSMDMTATATNAAAAATSTMDMTGSTSSSMPMSMDMSQMAMTFFTSVTTPLYSTAWTPTSDGVYAGTCVFIIVLAVSHRVLIALRNILSEPAGHSAAAAAAAARRRLKAEGGAPQSASSNDGHEEDVYPSRNGTPSFVYRIRQSMRQNPFRVASETVRGLAEVFISGIGYLLMIAVMTMNVGYFLSVLGGTFLGTFLVGRLGPPDNDAHH